MKQTSVWKKAQTLQLQVSENILPEFDIGFDKRIPKDVEEELRFFVRWVESNYRIPITLWVDFEYNHYLISKDGRRVDIFFIGQIFPLILYSTTKRMFRKYGFLYERNIVRLRKYFLPLLRQ